MLCDVVAELKMERDAESEAAGEPVKEVCGF
jgi:hypothetical protein